MNQAIEASLHAVMAPVFHLALVPAAPAGERDAVHVVERQRGEELYTS